MAWAHPWQSGTVPDDQTNAETPESAEPTRRTARFIGDYVSNFAVDYSSLFASPIRPPAPPKSEAEIKKEKALRKAADNRALELLRKAGPEGKLLAKGEAALVTSKRFPELTYGIVPSRPGKVFIFHRHLGSMGDLCIQPEDDAPKADVLLTRLSLCKHHEEELWRTGNFDTSLYEIEFFLPKQVRKWMRFEPDDD